MEQMVAMVLILTQLIKEWIRNENILPAINIKGWFVVLLSLLISTGIVFYNVLEKLREPVTFKIALTILTVWLFANGGKKLLNVVKPKI